MTGQYPATELLTRCGQGDGHAADQLLPLVYDELRRLAQHLLSREPSDITLQATALVHEAYLKLVDQSRANWHDEAHFMAVAAQAIRRILVDHARHRSRKKRGGDCARLQIESDVFAPDSAPVEVLEVDDLLIALAQEDQRAARVVELRFFGGLTIEQTAALLNISIATADRDWRYARAWLIDRLNGERVGRPPIMKVNRE